MDDGWYPTNDLRWVVNKLGDSLLQQRWVRGLMDGDGIVQSIRREDQWRIIRPVLEDDLTPEELGITRLADWPTPVPS